MGNSSWTCAVANHTSVLLTPLKILKFSTCRDQDAYNHNQCRSFIY
uniref:Uncharacterized protein n=1 Tax=Arundo donax TaxID=35708 RepID=A0A0A8Y2M7_ARUDO